MFKILITCCFLIITYASNAQYNSKGVDLISRFHPGTLWFFSGFEAAEEGKIRKYDRLIFDLVYNDWNGDQKPFNNKWASIGLNTNLMFDIPFNKDSKFSVGTGLSHSLIKIHHNNSFVVDSTNTFTIYQAKDSLSIFNRSFLNGNSISVPLEFRFRSEGWKHFKFHLGGKIGYQLNLYSKEITNGENGKLVQKNHNFPDVGRLIYSAHVRIGIRNWALFASYNFNPLFLNPKSTQLNLMQFGISVSLF